DTEKTYSAPFSTHLYSKEVVVRADGSEAQVYPRLQYGGAQLDDPARQRPGDITRRAFEGIGWGVLASVVLAALLVLVRAVVVRCPPLAAAADIVTGRTLVCWRSALVTAA